MSDDENSQAATKDAFERAALHRQKRLAAGKLTVVDATNVQPESRKPLVELAREFHCLPVAIVLEPAGAGLPGPEQGARRPGFRPARNPAASPAACSGRLRGLEREGFRQCSCARALEEVEAVSIERQPLWNNLKHEHGPFDIIGDIHGCYDELVELLQLDKLGYAGEPGRQPRRG